MWRRVVLQNIHNIHNIKHECRCRCKVLESVVEFIREGLPVPCIERVCPGAGHLRREAMQDVQLRLVSCPSVSICINM